ncbi:HupE/UreJ family protein [Pseudoduganella dura]|uniref:HupE/UreJ family protein n=1 Tax=Pseudoduganella dura TaxID=321982 RepID=UPI0019946661|nr:HupE/UreJ family protein [Pseudoduganella dura]GGY01240.1 membrane protein [Pseudoduganella dura]
MTARLVVRLLAVLALLFACALPAHAHKPSDSYLVLTLNGRSVEGQWDIALRDLDTAIGLDADGNGELTWDEVRNRHQAIAAYALTRLTLASGGAICPLKAGTQLVDHHTDGAYTVLRFRADCGRDIDRLDVGYRLLFDIDPQHRGLLRLRLPDGTDTATAVLSPENARQQFTLDGAGKAAQFGGYVRTGVWHIWIGFDHILFLVSLLLPAVLVYRERRWQPAPTFRVAAVDVLKIVTAFTVAHSITLTLATLQLVTLPSRWVESAIAASVVVAALNNLRPVVEGRRWIAAFVFGLIHGFGFASVLADLGLARDTLVLALVGFNVGVELGQLAIVAVFLPLAFRLRHTVFYRKAVLLAGSAIIACLATLWFVERAFDLAPGFLG